MRIRTLPIVGMSGLGERGDTSSLKPILQSESAARTVIPDNLKIASTLLAMAEKNAEGSQDPKVLTSLNRAREFMAKATAAGATAIANLNATTESGVRAYNAAAEALAAAIENVKTSVSDVSRAVASSIVISALTPGASARLGRSYQHTNPVTIAGGYVVPSTTGAMIAGTKALAHKLALDLDAKKITQAQFDQAIAAITPGAGSGATVSPTATIIS